MLPASSHIKFHTTPPRASSDRPRHRNRSVPSAVIVDSAGREHLYLNFWIEATPVIDLSFSLVQPHLRSHRSAFSLLHTFFSILILATAFVLTLFPFTGHIHYPNVARYGLVGRTGVGLVPGTCSTMGFGYPKDCVAAG